MKTKHTYTPSNWKDTLGGFIIDDDTGATMAEVFGDTIEERNVHSRLIASAPELLKALEMLHGFLLNEGYPKTASAIDGVIKKATK